MDPVLWSEGAATGREVTMWRRLIGWSGLMGLVGCAPSAASEGILPTAVPCSMAELQMAEAQADLPGYVRSERADFVWVAV
jgi:hypothetical protein